MTHDFSNLTSVLSRCSDDLAAKVIAEIRNAIADAREGLRQPATNLMKITFNIKKIKAQKATERAARRAEKKAAKQAQAAQEPAQTPIRIESTASEPAQTPIRIESTAQEPAQAPIRIESCGEAEAELLPPTPLPTIPSPARLYINAPMAGYIKRCSEENIQHVLNSYIHLLLTGSVYDTQADARYLNNFLFLAKRDNIITDGTAITQQQIDNYLYDNPVMSYNRATRRRLERAARKKFLNNRH
ncbi:MAG: hypothetical protein ACI391_01395 [Muribaculaceae bacterium]